MKTMKLRKALTTRCRQKHGTTSSSLLGSPSPQENKFLADDIAAASADGCSHQAPCCSIPSLPSQFVARATPPLTEARVGESRSSVSLHPPNSPAQLSGPQQVFLALSAYTQAHPPQHGPTSTPVAQASSCSLLQKASLEV